MKTSGEVRAVAGEAGALNSSAGVADELTWRRLVEDEYN